MRVLQVIQQLEPGGAEVVTLSLVRGLQERGVTTAVAAAPGTWSHRFPAPAFALPMIGRRPAVVPAAVLRLAQAVRAFRPDVVHCHNPAMASVAAAPTLRGRRPAALVTVHGVPERDYTRSGAVLRLAGLPVVSCGPGVTAALQERRIPVSATVPNGVAPPPPAADRQELLDRWGLGAPEALVISVGRLHRQKRHDVAIKAVAQLPRVALAVIGEGAERGALEALVADLGAGDRIRLVGTSPQARVCMAAADAVVLTSDWEGLPLALIEAMTSGVPVVATAARGIRELLHDGVDGLLCPVGDAAAVAAALGRVIDNAALGRALAAAAAASSEQYSERAMVEAYLELYERARA